MRIHKIIKIGDALGITMPRDFINLADIKKGEKFFIEVNYATKTLFIKPLNITYTSFLTPEFFKWLQKNEQLNQSK